MSTEPSGDLSKRSGVGWRPHLQYIHNTGLGSIGAGDVPLDLHFGDRMTCGDGSSFEVTPLMTGVFVYLRFTLWRRAR